MDPDFLSIPDPGVKEAPDPNPQHWVAERHLLKNYDLKRF